MIQHLIIDMFDMIQISDSCLSGKIRLLFRRIHFEDFTSVGALWSPCARAKQLLQQVDIEISPVDIFVTVNLFARLVVVVLKDILVLQNRQREAQNLFREEEKAFGSDPRLDPSFGDVDVASTACEATKIRKPE